MDAFSGEREIWRKSGESVCREWPILFMLRAGEDFRLEVEESNASRGCVSG
jgi:hypothetical protein